MLCSVCSVSLCCSVYCLCVNVYCTVLYCTVLYCTVLLPPGATQLQLINISYIISHHIITRWQQSDKEKTGKIGRGVAREYYKVTRL